MNILSLFDGIACGRVALERAGIEVNRYYASEIDKYAISIATKNYPGIIEFGDVNEWQYWNIDWDSIDLLIGGSPCQDLSIAKKDRKGLDGDRSGLFWRYVEILNRAKPKYFLLENVASMSKADKDKITEILGVEPIMINSALVSAQQRKRLYWTNIPNITQPEDKCILLKDILESGVSVNDASGKSYCIKAQYYKNSEANFITNNGFDATGVAEPIRIPPYGEADKSRPLTAHYSNNCGGWIDRMNDPNPAKQQIDMIAEPIVCPNKSNYIGEFVNNGYKNGKQSSLEYRIYSVQGKSLALNGFHTNYKIDLPDGDYVIRKLTPIECERLQTLPDNYTAGISNTQRYKCIGNGWTVDVIAHILSFIKEKK